MIVRFDSKLTKSIADRRTVPLGVAGDLSVVKEGGVSEADNSDGEAKNNAVNSDVTGVDEENPMEGDKLKTKIISKAASVEPGLTTLKTDEARNLTEPADLDIQNKSSLNDDGGRSIKQE
jgi:hypothetical protein